MIDGIQSLNGTVKGLSSEQIAHAVIDVKGQVDKYAPVFIYGKINPLSEQAYTDITLNFQGIELTTFSPYSGKFAGYTIEKGMLALELNYRLSQKILKGENHIVMDQFTLGENVESPDATKLPVRLAIAILKDSRGVIDIDLPVRGEGEELSFVSFAPGSNSLSQEQQSKLAKLAKALGDRPQLRLDVVRQQSSPTVKHSLSAQSWLVFVLRRLPLLKARLPKMNKSVYSNFTAVLSIKKILMIWYCRLTRLG